MKWHRQAVLQPKGDYSVKSKKVLEELLSFGLIDIVNKTDIDPAQVQAQYDLYQQFADKNNQGLYQHQVLDWLKKVADSGHQQAIMQLISCW